MRKINKLLISIFSCFVFLSCDCLIVHADNTANNSNDNYISKILADQSNSKPKRIMKSENINGTTSTIPKKDIVRNYNYGFYYNMTQIFNRETAIRGNKKVTFSHPMYLHYAKLTHYKSGRPYGDPQSMTILPDGRTYVLFNVGHSDSPYNRILEYNIKNRKLIKIGDIFRGGHGQGLAYDYKTHKLLLCMNHFVPYSHGLLKGDLLISSIGKITLKPFGKLVHIKAPKDMNLSDNFTTDSKGNYYNVSKYGNYEPFSTYGGLTIYRGNNNHMKLMKLLFNNPNSTVQNIEYNPRTKRIYIVGNGCITSFPPKKLSHLRNKDINVSIFDNPQEFESLSFYKKRAYLLVSRPSRILVSDRLF